MSEHPAVKRTPLYDQHLAAGGRMVEFAGYQLPVTYSSLEEEHRAVREAAGLFDVSHMGEIFIRGQRALDFVQKVSCNDHSKLAIGRAQYSGLMYPEGTFVDDMLVHRTAEHEYLLVVNAANRHKDAAYLAELAAGEPELAVEDLSDSYAQLAIQGPRAREILAPLSSVDLESLKYYRFATGTAAGVEALIARTGYTGEDGFELYTAAGDAAGLWQALVAEGQPKGLKPAGLGARDTLRFEAGMSLYGNEIDHSTTPLEAGLAWIVKLDKGDFIGRDVLERQAEEGVDRTIVGFAMVDRGIARHGYPVFIDPDNEEADGEVTSGTHSPTFNRALGMAYLPPAHSAVGSEFFVRIRNRMARARVVELPFYSRNKKKSS